MCPYFYVVLKSSCRSKIRKKEIRQLKKIGSDAEAIHGAEIAEMLSDAYPSWRNSLPILIGSFIYNVAISLPDFVHTQFSARQSRVESYEVC